MKLVYLSIYGIASATNSAPWDWENPTTYQASCTGHGAYGLSTRIWAWKFRNRKNPVQSVAGDKYGTERFDKSDGNEVSEEKFNELLTRYMHADSKTEAEKCAEAWAECNKMDLFTSDGRSPLDYVTQIKKQVKGNCGKAGSEAVYTQLACHLCDYANANNVIYEKEGVLEPSVQNELKEGVVTRSLHGETEDPEDVGTVNRESKYFGVIENLVETTEVESNEDSTSIQAALKSQRNACPDERKRVRGRCPIPHDTAVALKKITGGVWNVVVSGGPEYCTDMFTNFPQVKSKRMNPKNPNWHMCIKIRDNCVAMNQIIAKTRCFCQHLLFGECSKFPKHSGREHKNRFHNNEQRVCWYFSNLKNAGVNPPARCPDTYECVPGKKAIAKMKKKQKAKEAAAKKRLQQLINQQNGINSNPNTVAVKPPPKKKPAPRKPGPKKPPAKKPSSAKPVQHVVPGQILLSPAKKTMIANIVKQYNQQRVIRDTVERINEQTKTSIQGLDAKIDKKEREIKANFSKLKSKKANIRAQANKRKFSLAKNLANLRKDKDTFILSKRQNEADMSEADKLIIEFAEQIKKLGWVKSIEEFKRKHMF